MVTKEQLIKMYWQQGLTLEKIADKLNCPYHKIYRLFRVKYQIDTHKSIWKELQIKDKKLRYCLNNKYNNMRRRVSGEYDRYYIYNGKSLLNELEFVDFCNDNRQKILNLWQCYLDSGKQLKYAVSIDRINNRKGYTKDNLQFVTHGFNSWKDELNPVKITKDNQSYYFSSAEDASRFFDCRADDFREVLRNERYNRQEVSIQTISIAKLLKECKCGTLQEYYDTHLI